MIRINQHVYTVIRMLCSHQGHIISWQGFHESFLMAIGHNDQAVALIHT